VSAYGWQAGGFLRNYLAALFIVVLSVFAAAGTKLTPTTTLSAETSNNTSAANTFISQRNGNLGATNISKVSMRTLLYPGSTTKLYVHYMPWFGKTNHMNVGYNSSDPVQVARQVEDMISRGVQGAIADWYGPESTLINNSTLALRDYSTRRGDFEFALTEDVGALNACAATAGCDVTQKVINDLTYAWNTFEQSPAYMRYNGRPVVFFFGVEKYAIDWPRAKTNTPGNPLFIFRNSGAFTKSSTDGGFAWVAPTSTDHNNINLGYLDNFYLTSFKYPSQLTYGSAWKGFDDTLAAWTANRIMNQNCGQTWLASWAETSKYYSLSRQLYALQVATWNDYEEATEIESGIENCVSVTGAVSGNTLTWSITGSETTVDHYTVFASLDGQNLMPLADVPTGVGTLDLSQYGFGPATYTLYVKAIGKPSLRNQMSAPVTYTILNQPPLAILAVTPSSGIAPVMVNASTVGSNDVDGTIVSTTLDFGDGTSMLTDSMSHQYAAPGTYTVTATVMDDLGAISAQSTTVTVVQNQPPQASLFVTSATGIAPFTVSATTAASTDADGAIASSVISWGDGSTSIGPAATYVYPTPGTYSISATVTDDRGASSSASASVSVLANRPPIAKLTLTPLTGIVPITVTASTTGSSDLDGKIASTSINWGDGTSTASSTGSHLYSKAGTYKVTATVKDDRGATSSASSTVTVNWGVTITTPGNNATSSSPVHFIASATSNVAIVAMKIYVDNVAAYSINAAKLDTWVKMAAGTRRVVVQSWDANGVIYKTAIYVNVK
jgi:PKD repeat protein